MCKGLLYLTLLGYTVLKGVILIFLASLGGVVLSIKFLILFGPPMSVPDLVLGIQVPLVYLGAVLIAALN